MSQASGTPTGDAAPRRRPRKTTLGAAGYLGLAAAPTFAVMALLAGVLGGGDMICSNAPGASWLSGMTLMYALMSAFHSAPWLKLIANRRPRPSQPD